jgi:ribosome recycling factor
MDDQKASGERVMDEYIEDLGDEMGKPVRHLRSELAKKRTGRASLAVLDDVRIDYYGAPTPLTGVATLTVPEARMIIVKPWDPTMLAAIEKAISMSNIGITPNNDGKIIRLAFPELTGDRRKSMVREVEQSGETAKVRIRGVRRDYNDLLKGAEKDGDISEDDLKRGLDTVQKTTDSFCSKVDEVVKAKAKEILEV